jgi:SAM-dependent methyltransferase
MIFVLEHIAEPEKTLLDLKRFLKPNGKIIILVPNVQDALLKFYDIPKFGEFYFCIEHLFYYSPKTLGQLLKRCRLTGEAEAIQEYPVTNHLNWGYRQAPSDLLASRLKVPDIGIRDADLAPAWEDFWERVDQQYKAFLKANGFGDRVWCVAGKE